MEPVTFLNAVFRGKVAHRYGMDTAIDKMPTTERIYLSETGLAGDECAEKRFHGGTERALHQYPAEHYAYWREKYGIEKNWQAPGMGENLSTEGMTEDTVCLGDRYQWGEAIIEVSQPRSPCFKLNQRWNIEKFSVDMQDISRCGWLYRVIQPGYVSVSDPLKLIAREPNTMTLREVCDIYFGDPLNRDALLRLKAQSKLSQSWTRTLDKRLETNELENWNFRLLGHA
ncbi:MOSC domain-containing protein [Photobacterium atrarenae]|uniref:MOSC domain-containing protein n=1 Tax=Photobacterium atrarenae TaxID=865757 RepID=A0ABY5GLI7_9GAMM|nr:MOSC domain-containing protein [Photobacterium atrarenae]UTV29589.1 MOSC domain-containing protein [Photobacterium atrarenae]